MTADAAAWHPVVRSALLQPGRNIVAGFAKGVELALWRAADGLAQAWENRCPHRSVRLTLGQVVGDRVSCGYHGWQYSAGSGACVGIPAHPRMQPPRNVCVKTYAVAEAARMVWVRLEGEPADFPSADAMPEDWSFCRTLSVRAPAGIVAETLKAAGWRPVSPAAWTGQLGDAAARGFLLDAQPGVSMIHLWTRAAPSSVQMTRAHAAARRLRTDAEAADAGRA